MLSDHEILNYKADTNLLQNRTILVTGAGDGIGKTAAVSFAQHGAELILTGRTVAKLEQVYDEIIAGGGIEPTIHHIDLQQATPEDYYEMASSIQQQFGRLDGLLLNAGILGQRSPLNQYCQETWDAVLKVNVTAQFQMTQALIPTLVKSNDASVIVTSSSVGRVGQAFWGAYAVSKFAVEGLTQVWAAELEGTESVRINCINPGATRTDMRRQAYPAENPEHLKTPEDIMPAYMYLMGKDSCLVNGRSIDAQTKVAVA